VSWLAIQVVGGEPGVFVRPFNSLWDKRDTRCSTDGKHPKLSVINFFLRYVIDSPLAVHSLVDGEYRGWRR
jgi:hypothetical protein